MQRGLFFTTMRNHRPVYIPPKEQATTEGETKTQQPPTENKRQTPSLQNNITRSNQPVFSVSAMFGMKSGGGCGTCGH